MTDRTSPYNLASELRNLWSTCVIMKMTAREINSRVLEWEKTWPKRVTVHARGFVAGVLDQLRVDAWKQVEFCYRAPDGTIYSTDKGQNASARHKSTEELYSVGKGHILNNWESAHLWRDSDKPYTQWSYSTGAVSKFPRAD